MTIKPVLTITLPEYETYSEAVAAAIPILESLPEEVKLDNSLTLTASPIFEEAPVVPLAVSAASGVAYASPMTVGSTEPVDTVGGHSNIVCVQNWTSGGAGMGTAVNDTYENEYVRIGQPDGIDTGGVQQHLAEYWWCADPVGGADNVIGVVMDKETTNLRVAMVSINAKLAFQAESFIARLPEASTDIVSPNPITVTEDDCIVVGWFTEYGGLVDMTDGSATIAYEDDADVDVDRYAIATQLVDAGTHYLSLTGATAARPCVMLKAFNRA